MRANGKVGETTDRNDSGANEKVGETIRGRTGKWTKRPGAMGMSPFRLSVQSTFVRNESP